MIKSLILDHLQINYLSLLSKHAIPTQTCHYPLKSDYVLNILTFSSHIKPLFKTN